MDALPPLASYVPIDIAPLALDGIVARLARARPGLRVHPIVADFLAPMTLPPELGEAPRFGFFPGSTIGNLDRPTAERFLRQARQTLGEGALFLVGVDLRKDKAILVPAYDDAAGITAAFNLNLLHRLNREAGADFDVDAFAHRAIWNDAESRIEMHLQSRRDQVATVAGTRIALRAGETIHTENSYKYGGGAVPRPRHTIRMAPGARVAGRCVAVLAAPAAGLKGRRRAGVRRGRADGAGRWRRYDAFPPAGRSARCCSRRRARTSLMRCSGWGRRRSGRADRRAPRRSAPSPPRTRTGVPASMPVVSHTAMQAWPTRRMPSRTSARWPS